MKNIVIIATGGTIAGSGDAGKAADYQAGRISVSDILESVPSIRSLAHLKTVQMCNIDSNDMDEERWIALRDLIDAYGADPDVDGIVVTHGTDTLEETANLQDVGFFGYKEDADGNPVNKVHVMLAVPLQFRNSSKWKGRGESLIDKKETLFDALDEIVSQWPAAVRAARPTKYIPKMLAPRKADTGEIIPPNDFDNAYIAIGNSNKEGEKNEIKVVQPEIPSSSYLESYVTYLDLCLQGFISPSTLGIDTKKLDNAEAQREKEKTTLYTRNMIIEALQKALPKLVNVVLKAYDAFSGKSMPDEVGVTAKFGEYASPSFEALIETLSKAKSSNLMSIESLVDELYGDSKDNDWKAEEVERLKNELGIAENEPEDEGLENIEGGIANALLN